MLKALASLVVLSFVIPASAEKLGFCEAISAQVDLMCIPKIPIADYTSDAILDCQVYYLEQYVGSAEVQEKCEIVYANPPQWFAPGTKPYRLRAR